MSKVEFKYSHSRRDERTSSYPVTNWFDHQVVQMHREIPQRYSDKDVWFTTAKNMSDYLLEQEHEDYVMAIESAQIFVDFLYFEATRSNKSYKTRISEYI